MNVGYLILAWIFTWVALSKSGLLPSPEWPDVSLFLILATLALCDRPRKPGQTAPKPTSRPKP